MFVRFIIIIAVISLSECRRCHHLRHRHRHWSLRDPYSEEDSEDIEDIFETIADIVSEIDEDLGKTCRLESITALNKFNKDGYSRKIIIAGFDANTVSIRIKQRVMYTKVDHLHTGRRGLKDIKILPFNLNTTEAAYEIKNDALSVNIPYLDDFLDFCNHKMYEHMIYVPQMSEMSENGNTSQDYTRENASYEIDPRFGRDSQPISGNAQT